MYVEFGLRVINGIGTSTRHCKCGDSTNIARHNKQVHMQSRICVICEHWKQIKTALDSRHFASLVPFWMPISFSWKSDIIFRTTPEQSKAKQCVLYIKIGMKSIFCRCGRKQHQKNGFTHYSNKSVRTYRKSWKPIKIVKRIPRAHPPTECTVSPK